ncbi:VOC family protein [Ferrovibrio sp.]|uniref:VOC family protein n=1 Tax=Ferrovibrio sp. TaxID=1917215 RepID=UPI0025C258DC|nr:VOC family protein [Ferrovibrio sp.]
MELYDHLVVRNPVLRPRRLGHVNLFVSSLAKAREFYSETCGFVEIFEEPLITAAFMSNGNTHHDLGLIEASTTDRVDKDGKVLISAAQRGSKASLNHLGFEMDNEKQLVEAYENLKKLGVKAMRTIDHGLAHSVYMPDPDGNMLEFYADVIDDWRSFWKDSVGKTVTGGWQPALEGADGKPHYPDSFEPDIHPSSPIKSRRVTCATIATSNFKAMLDFYLNVVGLELLPGSDARHAILAGTTGEATLRLQKVEDPKNAAFSNMGIELGQADTLVAAKAYLRSKGYPIQKEENGDGQASFLTMDPDGFGVWFYAPTTNSH